jgi:tetratricopeptide (TPR) repeat protein
LSTTTIAEHRRTDPHRLMQTVRGELDWIVMKCLEKDRNRRYETPNSLARDVERHLSDDPVQACPPSKAYRLHKFARRNKTLLTASGAIAAALVVGLGLSTWMYFRERAAVQVAKSNEQRAITQTARAQAVSDLLQEMLASSNPDQTKGSEYTVRELLDDFSAGLGDQLAGDREVEAAIRSVIGKSYWRLGVTDRAELNSKKALDLRRQLFGPDDERVADSLVDYAWTVTEQGRHEDAETHVRDALSIYHKKNSDPHRTVRALWSLQQFLMRQSRLSDAEETAKDALALAGNDADSDYAELPNILHALAEAKSNEGKYEEAEKFAQRAVALHRRLHSDHHPETAYGLRSLAIALKGQQKFTEAEPPLREALTIFRRQFPEDHPNIRDTMDQLRTILEARGDKPALEALDKEAADYAMRSGSPGYHIQLAEILADQSRTVRGPEDVQRLSMAAAVRTEEAHRHIRQAIEAYDRMATDSPNNFNSRLEAIKGFIQVLSVCLAATGFAGEVDELNRRLEAELPKLVAAFPDSNHCQLQTAYRYVEWAYALGPYPTYRSVEEHAFRKEIEILERLSLSNPKQPELWLFLADAYDHLGSQYWDSARPQDAEAAFLRAKEIYDQHSEEIATEKPTQAFGIAAHYGRQAYFLAHTHREDEAAECVRKAADIAKHVTDPVLSVSVLWAMTPVQLRIGDHAGYRETCKALVEVPVADADDLTKARQIFAWVHGPDALDDLSLPVKRAEELAAHSSIGWRDFILFDLGAALYRNRQYQRAAEQLEASIAAYPSDPEPFTDPISFPRLFLAMTKWQLGQHAQARQLLEKTLPDVDKDLQSNSLGWNQRAALEVIRREAQALIKPKEAREAVENGKANESASTTND